MAEFSYEDISVFLPKYLSPEEQQGLFKEIKKFPDSFVFFDNSHQFDSELLQGDGWRGLVAINFQTLDKKVVSGVVISNSCDIDIRNKRDFNPNILFAPILKLESVKQKLLDGKKSEEYIEERFSVIRKQRLTSMFYIPEKDGVINESVILLDDIHRHPLDDFVATEKTKLFTLSQAAFYLFLIKLSIHFHRVHEGVHRFIPPAE